MPTSSEETSISVPPFESKLPAELLDGLDQRGRYLYMTMDEIRQAQQWLTEQAITQHETSQQIKKQVMVTNGRLLRAEDDIDELQAYKEDTVKEINLVKLFRKILKNRWFWIGVTAFLVFGVPWLATHAPMAKEFFKLLFA